jgi:hypothetical protein
MSGVVSAGIAGGLYFLPGFFRPIWFDPTSNRGPLAGIFFTAPAGVVVGGALELVMVLSDWPRDRGSCSELLSGFSFQRSSSGRPKAH